MDSKINPLLHTGDHLIARRFAYTHHGLYMGEGKVLEYIQDGGVTIVTLETFAQHHAIYIREHPNAKYKGEAAVQRGLTRLGENHYNLFTCNCEHFVNWCIDGVENSRQVDNLILTIIPFYSLFHRSNFIRGCLKIIFDNPASLDAALERINIHNLNVTDPLTRARELSEDVFGTKRQGIVNLTAKITAATQISKEYTSWLRYKQHSITSHLAALNRTLSHPGATLHKLSNKLGLLSSSYEHSAAPAPAPAPDVASAPAAPAPESAKREQGTSAIVPANGATRANAPEKTNTCSAALPATLELHAEATVAPPEVFWRRLSAPYDARSHHSWLGSSLASLTAIKVLKQKQVQSHNTPLDPEISGNLHKLPEAVHPEFAEFELPTKTEHSAPICSKERATAVKSASVPALEPSTISGNWDQSIHALSARLPSVYVHLECSMLNGKDMEMQEAHKEMQRASLEHSQSELATMIDPRDWHNSVSQKQAVDNTTHEYKHSSLKSAYQSGDGEYGYGYALSDLALEVADQVRHNLRTQQRTWRHQQRHGQANTLEEEQRKLTTSSTTTTSVPLLAFKSSKNQDTLPTHAAAACKVSAHPCAGEHSHTSTTLPPSKPDQDSAKLAPDTKNMDTKHKSS